MNTQWLPITLGNDPAHSTGPAGPDPCPSLRLSSFLPLITDPLFWFSKIPSPLHPQGLCTSYYSAVKSFPRFPLGENFLSLREPHFLSELPSGLGWLWRCVFRPSHPHLSSASPPPPPIRHAFTVLGSTVSSEVTIGLGGLELGGDGFGLAEQIAEEQENQSRNILSLTLGLSKPTFISSHLAQIPPEVPVYSGNPRSTPQSAQVPGGLQ